MIVGLVSTRFAGLDGVSLEVLKIADVLIDAGHEVVWFAGELSSSHQPGVEYPPAHFAGSANEALQQRAFGHPMPDDDLISSIASAAGDLQSALAGFLDTYDVDVVVPHNALSIPMQLPLGVAIKDLLLERGTRAVAHHHDFGWERQRFSVNCVPELLAEAFPPTIPNLEHVVINSLAHHELSRRRGVSSTVIPNVMDFGNPPIPGDGASFRRHANLSNDDTVLLQPTRIIPRKGIEMTLELARALEDQSVKVVITHPELDEQSSYWDHLTQLAERLDVDLRLVPADSDSGPYLADAYAAADLVTFPSLQEGFGNALLEAFYYRRPTLVNRYDVYVADIAPTGTRCIEIEGSITPETVTAAVDWLGGNGDVHAAIEQNYHAGLKYFSYQVLAQRLLPLIEG